MYTTCHGIGNIIRANNFILRVIWLAFLTASFSYCSYQVIMNIMGYFNFEVIISSKVVNEAPAVFPTVDFCNLNPYDGFVARDYMAKTLKDKNIVKDNYTSVRQYIDVATAHLKSNMEKDGGLKIIDLYNYGFFFSQMFISCRFQGKECNEHDFYYFHNYHYGSCYRFNGGIVGGVNYTRTRELKKSTKPGWRSGLSLELYVGDPIYQQQFTYKGGIRIIVHNDSSNPFLDEDGIDVSTGMQTNIAVSRTFINRLSAPYSNCIEKLDSETKLKNEILGDMFDLHNLTKYDQKFCLKLCIQYFITANCNCFDLSSPFISRNSNKTIHGCTSITEVDCLQQIENLFYNSDEVNTCYEKCPLECDIVAYDLTVSLANYPTEWYANHLMNNSNFTALYSRKPNTLEEVQQTTLMVNVFYDQMLYNILEETPKVTYDSLIAFVGGNFGLFMGISILSLVEFVEILFYAVYLVIKQK